MSNNIKRRNFLRNSLLAAGGIVLAPNFISCSDSTDKLSSLIPKDLTNKNFNQGVASFDPTNSQVIIWTRYNTDKSSVKIVWQLAKDTDFKDIVRQGEVTTDTTRDYTLAIEIKDLDENLKLFYRFVNIDDKTSSPIGETLTFGNNTSEVKLAVASCSNYAAGYFNVYEAIKNSDADAVVHLGDYIYEYGEGTYGTFRNPEPAGEIISLDDYRTRYRQYRSEDQLKELHQKKPFICVWDDHEVTNDAYKDGAENHQADEGDYQIRKQNALQVYSEYLPNTTNLSDSSIIYRTLKLGSLVDLIMLDTRVVGRDKQLDYATYTSAAGFDTASFQADWLNPSRTILGQQQKDWLKNEMSNASSQWQIIGQQVLMGKMYIPAELLSAFGSSSFATVLGELVQIKARLLQNDPTLTDAEKARVTNVIPYNLDAWDGYFAEREEILSTFKDKKVIVLAGDTHNAWQTDLITATGEKVGIEVATSSVSSPGFESFVGVEGAAQLGTALKLLIDDLKFSNLSDRGYMKLTVNAGAVKTDWNYVDTITEKTFTTTTKNTLTI
ncbi:alkaline phosphatase D family protein [Tenacibaculum sp. M341]|uniref:alkaline phosphatase D family protein n=1 Tax=Tenacibaculum sp. M341 TaxID=2530339 RepID=UPI001049A646|nr:alkaline phosphatase D family protein [Tenacibaculum sp. M341]TCI93539.1 alkaline phosphatase [Tenacibaculum sp. M341]